MAKTKVQKHQLKDEMGEKLSRSKAVIFADYQGLTMKHLSDLRDKLRAEDAELAVTKNTLMRIALKEQGYIVEDESHLDEGPTATLFSFRDEVAPLKILVKALKDAQIGKVKAGFIGKDFYDEKSMIRLAALPAKAELQAKVVGSLASPLYGIVGVLHANLRNFVYALDQIRIKKGGE